MNTTALSDDDEADVGADNGIIASFSSISIRKSAHKTKFMGPASASSSASASVPKDPPHVRTFAFWTPCVFHCPLPNCPPDTLPMTNPHLVLDHLQTAHFVVIEKPEQCMPFLDSYVCVLGKRFAEIPAAPGVELLPGLSTCQNAESSKLNGQVLVIDPDMDSFDKKLRQDLQRIKLNEMLSVQDRERRVDSSKPRKCIFCRVEADNRSELFKHLFNDHSFNIGLPDNLVDVDEFLDCMRAKLESLQCLYCEKTFTTPAVLRAHMRKKKHFKINPRNQIYDRFYIINYLEPGKNWEAYQEEKYATAGEEGDGSDNWDDWNEDEDLGTERTMCLFCSDVCTSRSDAVGHMRFHHGFDLKEIKKNLSLDFYGVIRLINCVRYWSSKPACYICKEAFENSDELTSHFEESGHARSSCVPMQDGEADIWTDAMYLFPTFEDDPLLMWDSEEV